MINYLDITPPQPHTLLFLTPITTIVTTIIL